MNPATILERAAEDGLTLTVSPDGKIKIKGDQNKINKWIEVIRENKAAILLELRGPRILEMLAADLEKKYAVLVQDADSDPVRVTVGIRGLATFDLEIPRARYDGIALLEVIEQYSMDIADKPSGITYPLPQSEEPSLSLSGEGQRKAA
jgi:hypothetical protein